MNLIITAFTAVIIPGFAARVNIQRLVCDECACYSPQTTRRLQVAGRCSATRRKPPVRQRARVLQACAESSEQRIDEPLLVAEGGEQREVSIDR
jgi:hypothetical protein